MTDQDFDERLAWSHSNANEPWWNVVYQQAFPGCTTKYLEHNGSHQKRGIDRAIILADGGDRITVEEKARKWDYDDLCIEYWSQRYPDSPWKNKRGWIYTNECDYLAYAFVPTRRCFLLPMRELRRAYIANKDEWGMKARAESDGFSHSKDTWTTRHGARLYETLWMAVPFPIVQAAMNQSMLFHWSGL